jgi:hypothetical protein
MIKKRQMSSSLYQILDTGLNPKSISTLIQRFCLRDQSTSKPVCICFVQIPAANSNCLVFQSGFAESLSCENSSGDEIGARELKLEDLWDSDYEDTQVQRIRIETAVQKITRFLDGRHYCNFGWEFSQRISFICRSKDDSDNWHIVSEEFSTPKHHNDLLNSYKTYRAMLYFLYTSYARFFP